jgi:hypothetical protein
LEKEFLPEFSAERELFLFAKSIAKAILLRLVEILLQYSFTYP